MRCSSCVALVVAMLAAGASSARAAFTTINAPGWPGEDNRQQIFSAIYGGTFNPVVPGSLNYTNGSIVATRIEDIVDPTISPAIVSANGPIGDDQLWQANFQSASAEAVFASFNQQFGYFDGTSGGSYVNLFNVTGVEYGATGSANLTSLSGHVLRWGRAGQSRTFSSEISDNVDQADHMVTFRIDGLQDNKLTWLLMWEDKKTGETGADFDFNDLVVKVTALPVTNIPEPMALMPLLGVSLLSLRKRRNA